YPNALIPSAGRAVTTADYRRAARRTAGSESESGNRLYSGVVEFGVVTDATWRVIRMLPPKVRKAYEALRVDALMLYPRALAAATPEEYRELTARYAGEAAPWAQELDLRRLRVTERRPVDHAFVSFLFPVRDLATR